jgi:hypothetical protein
MKKQKRSQTSKTEVSLPSTKKSEFPFDKLMQALYWAWDAFDRANMGMFLVYDTAADVLQNKMISGDKVTIGVRKNEWISGSTPILKAFTGEPIETTDKYVVFKNPLNDVPVYLYIFEEDPCIISTQEILYEREYFKLPNTYRLFIDRFGATP